MSTLRSTPDDAIRTMRVSAVRTLSEHERALQESERRAARLKAAIATEKDVIESLTSELLRRGIGDDLPDGTEQRVRDHNALLELSEPGTVLIDGESRWTLLLDGMWRPSDGGPDIHARQVAELISAGLDRR